MKPPQQKMGQQEKSFFHQFYMCRSLQNRDRVEEDFSLFSYLHSTKHTKSWGKMTRQKECEVLKPDGGKKPGRPVCSDSSVLCPLCAPFFPPEGWNGAFSNGQGLMGYYQTRKVRYFPKGWFQGRKEIRILFLGFMVCFGKRVLVAMACL